MDTLGKDSETKFLARMFILAIVYNLAAGVGIRRVVAMYLYIIAGVVILLDQLTKRLVMQNMYVGESIKIIEDIFYFTSHRNQGAAWGILQGQMMFFYIVTVVFVIGLLWYVREYGTEDKLFGVGIGLILGGAIGNFIDRVLYQEVVDFIDTFIFSYNFPIFNVADIALTIGVALIFIQTLLEAKREKREQNGAS